MSTLKQQFEEAVDYVQSGSGQHKPDRSMKLRFYALYKQATEGDVKGGKPRLTDVVGRAKYGAWADAKGMSADDAMRAYIDALAKVR